MCSCRHGSQVVSGFKLKAVIVLPDLSPGLNTPDLYQAKVLDLTLVRSRLLSCGRGKGQRMCTLKVLLRYTVSSVIAQPFSGSYSWHHALILG